MSRRETGWHVAPRVLQQRDQIVGRRADHRVLEIEQAAGLDAVAALEQHEIVDVIVAQHQGRRQRQGVRQHRAPGGKIALARTRLPSARPSPPAGTNRRAAPPRRGAAPRRRAAASSPSRARSCDAARSARRRRARRARARRRPTPGGAYRCRRRNPPAAAALPRRPRRGSPARSGPCAQQPRDGRERAARPPGAAAHPSAPRAVRRLPGGRSAGRTRRRRAARRGTSPQPAPARNSRDAARRARSWRDDPFQARAPRPASAASRAARRSGAVPGRSVDIETLARQQRPQPLRPFDERDAAAQGLLDAELVDLLRLGQAIEIEMPDRRPAGRARRSRPG